MPLLIAGLVAGMLLAQPALAQMPRMLVAAGDKVFTLEPDKSVSWVLDGQRLLFDAWPLANGNVLFSSKFAVYEVNPEKQVVWQYDVEPDSSNEIDACQPLDNGNVLIMDSGSNRLIEVNRAKEIQVEIQLPSKEENPHRRYRIARKTSSGKYHIAMLPDRVLEYAADGKLLRELDLKTLGAAQGELHSFEILDLPNGNLLISTGFDGRWLEVTPENRVVWEVSKKTMPDLKVGFAAGAIRLPSGNTILCNGDWHTKDPEVQKMQLLETTQDHEVVWSVSHAERNATQ
jgi:hypothetical protein